MARRLLIFFSAVLIATGVVVMPPRAAAQTSASGARPLLVVVLRLADSSSVSGFVGPWDHGYSVNRYFGGDGVTGYMRAASRGMFSYVPAVGDGVVEVDYPGTMDDFSSAQRTAVIALRSADASVDFASFDRDRDGLLEQSELAVEAVVLGGDRRGPGETRAVAGYDSSFTQLDGVGFGGDFMVATVNGFSKFMTAVHELFHQSFDAYDAYYWGVGALDVMGPTYDSADSDRWMPSAPLRMQLGWISPTAVDEDGWFNLSQPLLIRNRFVVELRGTNAWDRNASARGVVLWRLSGNRYDLLTPDVVLRDAQLAPCDSSGCRAGGPSDAFGTASVPLHYGPSNRPYSSGAYTGIVLDISNGTVGVRFNVAEPVAAPRVRPSRVQNPTTSSSIATTSTTVIDEPITAAPGLWPRVFNTDELRRLITEMCALELPGCAIYQLQEMFLYP